MSRVSIIGIAASPDGEYSVPSRMDSRWSRRFCMKTCGRSRVQSTPDSLRTRSTLWCHTPMTDLEWSDAPSAEIFTIFPTPAVSAAAIAFFCSGTMSSTFPVSRNSRSAPANRSGSRSRSARSPLAHSTPGSSSPRDGSREIARASTPCSERIRSSSLPMVPVAPVTTIIDHLHLAGSSRRSYRAGWERLVIPMMSGGPTPDQGVREP